MTTRHRRTLDDILTHTHTRPTTDGDDLYLVTRGDGGEGCSCDLLLLCVVSYTPPFVPLSQESANSNAGGWLQWSLVQLPVWQMTEMEATDPPIFRSTLRCLQGVLALQSQTPDHGDICNLVADLEGEFVVAKEQDKLAVLPFVLSVIKHIVKHPSSSASGAKPSKMALGVLEMSERCFATVPQDALHVALLAKNQQDNDAVCQEIALMLLTILDALRPSLCPPDAPGKSNSRSTQPPQTNADVEALALGSFRLLETIVSAFLQRARSAAAAQRPAADSIFAGQLLAPLIQQCLLAAHTPSRPLSLCALSTLSLLLDLTSPPGRSPAWSGFFPGIFSALYKLGTDTGSGKRGAAIRSRAAQTILQALAALGSESAAENVALRDHQVSPVTHGGATDATGTYATFRLNILQHVQRPLLLLLPPLLLTLPPTHRVPLYAALHRLLKCATFFGPTLERDIVPMLLLGVTDDCLETSGGIWSLDTTASEGRETHVMGSLLGSPASLQRGLVESLRGIMELCTGAKMGPQAGDDGDEPARGDELVLAVLPAVSEQALEILLRTAIGYAHVLTVFLGGGARGGEAGLGQNYGMGAGSVASSPLRPVLRAVPDLCYAVLPLLQPGHAAVGTQLLEVACFTSASLGPHEPPCSAAYSSGYYRSPLACSLSDNTRRLGRQLCAVLGRGGMVPDLLEVAAHLQRQAEADDSRSAGRGGGDPAGRLCLVAALRAASYGMLGLLEVCPNSSVAQEASTATTNAAAANVDPDAVVCGEWRCGRDAEGERERERTCKAALRLAVKLLGHHLVRLPAEVGPSQPSGPTSAVAPAAETALRSALVSSVCELLASCAMLVHSSPQATADSAGGNARSAITPRLFLVSALYPLLQAAIAADTSVRVAARTSLGRIALYFTRQPALPGEPEAALRSLLLAHLDLLVDSVCASLQASSSDPSGTAHRDNHLVLEFALKTARSRAGAADGSPRPPGLSLSPAPQVAAQLQPLLQAAFSSIDRLALRGRLGTAASRPLWGVLQVLVSLMWDEASGPAEAKAVHVVDPRSALVSACERAEDAIGSSLRCFHTAVVHMLAGEDYYCHSSFAAAASTAEDEDAMRTSEPPTEDVDEDDADAGQSFLPPFPEHDLLQSVALRCCYFMVAGAAEGGGPDAALLYDRVQACGVMERAFIGLGRQPGDRARRAAHSSLLLPTIHKVWPTVVSRLTEAADALAQYRETNNAALPSQGLVSAALGTGAGLGGGSAVPSIDKALNTPFKGGSACLQTLPALLSLLSTISTLGGDFLAIKYEDDFWALFLSMLHSAAGLRTLRLAHEAAAVSSTPASPSSARGVVSEIAFRDATQALDMRPSEPTSDLPPSSHSHSHSHSLSYSSQVAFPPNAAQASGFLSHSLHTRIKAALLRFVLSLADASATPRSEVLFDSIRALFPAHSGRLVHGILPLLLSAHGPEVTALASQTVQILWRYDRGWVGAMLRALLDASLGQDVYAWPTVCADPRLAAAQGQRGAAARRLPEAVAKDSEGGARLRELLAWTEGAAVCGLVDGVGDLAWQKRLVTWGAGGRVN